MLTACNCPDLYAIDGGGQDSEVDARDSVTMGHSEPTHCCSKLSSSWDTVTQGGCHRLRLRLRLRGSCSGSRQAG